MYKSNTYVLFFIYARLDAHSHYSIPCDKISLFASPTDKMKGTYETLQSLYVTNEIKQDCFLQKEARVCVNNAFVIEDSKFKWRGFFGCGRWASDRGSRYANVNIVIEWKGMLAEGTVVWNN